MYKNQYLIKGEERMTGNTKLVFRHNKIIYLSILFITLKIINYFISQADFTI